MADNYFKEIRELAIEAASRQEGWRSDRNTRAKLYEEKKNEIAGKFVSAIAAAMERDYGDKPQEEVLSYEIVIKEKIKDCSLSIWETLEVVKKPENDAQIALKNAKKVYEDAEIGDTVKVLVPASKYNKVINRAFNNMVFFLSAQKIAAMKNIPSEQFFAHIEKALESAMKKDYGATKEKEREIVVCHIDPSRYLIDIWANLEVVEQPLDHSQISLEDALQYDKNAKLGDIVKKPIPLSEYGRIAAQKAKHVIRQGIKEAEKQQQIDALRAKKKEIVSAKVSRIDPVRGHVSLEVSGGELVLPKKEQVPGESFKEGQFIQVYIVDVTEDERGSKVMISRTHPGFVRRLFEREVPEIQDGTVEIKSVSREAGSRTKLAVYSADEDVDPVGACIGPRGGRVNTIVDILGGEKIDIIKYSDSPEEYISAALAPADVTEVLVKEGEGNKCKVAVPDNQLSLAIGNKGQNARLAAKLTGWKIDIKPESVYYEELENEKVAALEAEVAEQEAKEVAEQEAKEAEESEEATQEQE